MARHHVELCRRFTPDTISVSTVAPDNPAWCDQDEAYPILRERFTFREAKRLTSAVRWAAHLEQLARESIDVLHCGNIRSAGYAVWWASRRLGIPYLLYVNGTDVLIERRKARSLVKRLFARNLFEGAAAVIAPSAWTAGVTRALLGELNARTMPRIEVVELGTDPTWFRPDRDTAAFSRTYDLDGRLVALTVARLVPHKGQDVAIRAVKALRDKGIDLRYLIVGEGLDHQRLSALANELGLEGVVRFTGRLSDAEIADAFARADLYLGISREDDSVAVEGFGISFAEAAASGTPAIAGDSGGIRSAVIDGVTGILIPPNDVVAAAAAIERLARDDALRARMGREARSLVEDRLNWARCALRTREIAAWAAGALHTGAIPSHSRRP